MRHLLPWVTSLAICALGCDGTTRLPTAPSQPPTLVSTGPLVPFAGRYTSVAVGDVIRAQVTADDVPCDFGYYCRYFLVMAPREGTLEIGLTHAPGAIYAPPMTPIDMWISGARGGQIWMDTHYPDVEGYARIRASAGATYQVGVVSYEMPGVAFQLRFSLAP